MTFEKMIKCCGNLTPTESQLAQYILRNKEEVQTSSIQSLSEKTFASKSAIHRFCKKIGFEGFNDLKVKIAKDLVEESKGVPHIDVNFHLQHLIIIKRLQINCLIYMKQRSKIHINRLI